MRFLWACSVAIMYGLSLASPLFAQEPLRIGVLSYRAAEHSLDHWKATERALNTALPNHAFQLEPLDLTALDAALAAEAVDFVITNPGHYATLEYDHHISRIATAEGDWPVASTLVSTGGVDTLTQLASQRLAVVSPDAFGGSQLVRALMQDVDARLPGQVELLVTGYPMQQVAEAVLDGRAEAAVLRACLLEELKAENPARFATLQPFALNEEATEATGCATSSAVFPGWPFAKAEHTSPELAKAVAIALMQMNEGNLWTVPLDYQPVHDLLRKLQIGPYARTGPVSLRDFIADYREWLIVLAAALAFWALYSVRIETLVRRRTRALDTANVQLKQEMIDRQRAEAADRQHRRELEHVARLSILGEMASSIAHELNQPLSAISNYAQGCLLRIEAGRFSEEDMVTASQEMAGQADRAATVVKRIRAFVRKRESQMAPTDIQALIEESAALYAAPANRAGVTVGVHVAFALPTVMADQVQLQQVLLNLVQNAIDAMGDTDPEARSLDIRAARYDDLTRGAGLCLSVRDHGHGMTPEAMDHFAEAFYTTKPEGIGLGLALSRSIVEAHGGWMRAEAPANGPGLKVLIWLPIEEET